MGWEVGTQKTSSENVSWVSLFFGLFKKKKKSMVCCQVYLSTCGVSLLLGISRGALFFSFIFFLGGRGGDSILRQPHSGWLNRFRNGDGLEMVCFPLNAKCASPH